MTDTLSYANVFTNARNVTDLTEDGWDGLHQADDLRLVLPRPPIDEVLDDELGAFPSPDPVVDLRLLEEQGIDWFEKLNEGGHFADTAEDDLRQWWADLSDDEKAEQIEDYLRDQGEYDARKRAYYETTGWDALTDDEINDVLEAWDRYGEWSDGFYPMMNAYWPVDLPLLVSEERAAEEIQKRAGVMTLVEIGGRGYALAMAGGGMDLSWDIATAYVCCGCVPPAELLMGLPHMGSRMNSDVVEAIALAANFVRRRADRLMEDYAKWKEVV